MSNDVTPPRMTDSTISETVIPALATAMDELWALGRHLDPEKQEQLAKTLTLTTTLARHQLAEAAEQQPPSRPAEPPPWLRRRGKTIRGGPTSETRR